MKWQQLAVAGAVACAGLVGGSAVEAGQGGDGRAYVVRPAPAAVYGSVGETAAYRAAPGPVRVEVDDDRPFIEVIQRTVVEPAAVIPRALAEQPVYTYLVELRVGPTTTLIDPDRDLRRETGGIDEDHYLIEAQRIYRSAQARPARVIRRPLSASEVDPQATILPRAIIHIPDALRRGEPAPTMPSVPAPPADLPLQMTQSD